MSTQPTKVEGIYFNTSPDPVFLEGTLIGGHEHVFIDGYARIPGHFILMDDPQEDVDAPEAYQRAYTALREKAQANEEQVHAASANRRLNVTTEEDVKEGEKKQSRGARKGKRDSSADDVDNQ